MIKKMLTILIAFIILFSLCTQNVSSITDFSNDAWSRGGVFPTSGLDDNNESSRNVAIKTDYIKVLKGSTIKNLDTTNYRLVCHVYSLNGRNWLRILFDTSVDNLSEHTVTADCYVKLIMVKPDFSSILDSEMSTLIGNARIESENPQVKTVNAIGDSITYGIYDAMSWDTVAYKYCDTVAINLGMYCNNYGLSGSVIAVNSNSPLQHDPISVRYVDMSDNSDIIIVFAGTNDWSYGWTPIGTISDTTYYTFYGALNILCEGLLNKYPEKQIIFCTPIKRITEVYTTIDSVNSLGKTLKDYGDIIKEVCARYSIQVADLYTESGLNPQIPAQKALLMPDGTHPNQNGHNKIADKLIKQLN
jgi:hypothetical protein